MPEACTYGGDAGTPIAGFVWFPGSGPGPNRLRVSHGTYPSISTVTWTAKINLDTLGAGHAVIGWGWGLSVTGDRRLNISLIADFLEPVGDAPSQVAVPGLDAGRDVWIRGRVECPSALCTYAYSYDVVLTEDEVEWIELGAAQPGVSGTPDPGITSATWISSFVPGTPVGGIGGRIYYASEAVNGVRTLVMNNTDIPDDSATSFPLSLGGTATVFSSGG